MGAAGQLVASLRRFEPRRAGFALLALTTLGSAWSDPASTNGVLRTLMESRGFTASQTDAAFAMLERAEAEGLPTSALANRIHEGIARRAAPSAILGVLTDRLGDLERADDIARRSGREGITIRDRERSVLRLSDSLSMGVTPGDVLSVVPSASRAGRDLESVSRAGEVMGRLGQKGFPPSETREIVTYATSAGWTKEDMDGLASVFLEAKRLGIAKDRLRQALADGIRDKKDASGLVENLNRNARDGSGTSEPADARDSASGASGSPKSGKAGGAHGSAPRTKAPPPHPPVPRGPHR